MASKGSWTIVFEDKMIIKQKGDRASGFYFKETTYDSFWNDTKWSNVWAIQYVADNEDYNDTVEYRDQTPHSTWTDANLGSFQVFIDKWDEKHLARLQEEWDNNNGSSYDDDGNEITPAIVDESNADKITRLGARPTSYSS
jgi:hypothetical protein